MEPLAIILMIAVAVVLIVVGAFALGIPVSGRSGAALRDNYRTIVAAQRTSLTEADQRRTGPDISAVTEEESARKISESKMTLRKKLKFAQLDHLPPFVVSLSTLAISLTAFLIVRNFFDMFLQLISFTAGPLVMNWYIMRRVNKRFEKFDGDYPQFLLQLTGLLKTGMNPMQALEAAAKNLDAASLVRSEVELMLERLRMGVNEDRSIGSFGEDINHPEIELFVQALLLSRRVGGTLSDTLERLAKQVRKRQYFRSSAIAAIGLQRGSIWFILSILMALEGYLYWIWPDCITKTWTDPVGRQVGQAGLGIIMAGMYWVRQVTKIKV